MRVCSYYVNGEDVAGAVREATLQLFGSARLTCQRPGDVARALLGAVRQ